MSYAISIDAKRARLAAAVAVVALWTLVYRALPGFAAWATYAAIGIERDTRLGASVEFFLYDTPKVLLLLLLVVFGVGVVRSYFSPARTRRLIAGRREFTGNVLGALLGIVTPFLFLLGGAALHRASSRPGCRSAGRSPFSSRPRMGNKNPAGAAVPPSLNGKTPPLNPGHRGRASRTPAG